MNRTQLQGPKVNRRRFVKICAAAAAGLALTPGLTNAQPILHRWRGVALGAKAEINLLHEDRDKAQELFRLVETEIRRLEAVFSLYREDSELARLNRDGRLTAPSLDMINLLGLSQRIHVVTEGAFDPSVQPLWDFYARQASEEKAVKSSALDAVVRRTGFRHVVYEPGFVEFGREGMALTLNGIAQGYITDRVAALLAARGCVDMAVDLGEISASGNGIGSEVSGRKGWAVTLRPDPEVPDVETKIEIVDAAVASSARKGTTFDQAGTVSHILDPRTGLPVQSDLTAASVVARTAAYADGLSTAALVCGEKVLSSALAHVPGSQAFVLREDGKSGWLG
ncbi:MAG: FAD:protein FMN transferase [Roseibium sp.]|uniref:FAD:protein FMN transferase n=1 Tax=Roseibium sp. TaxID=1936156 RepID=UPI002626337D|nr:FAD:protein FMN transferase [Roseibium sp.]MCV0427946.1 FAD:protein FMN transferase [Roseibium sp.]